MTRQCESLCTRKDAIRRGGLIRRVIPLLILCSVVVSSTAMAESSSHTLSEGEEISILDFLMFANGTMSFSAEGAHIFNLTIRTFEDTVFEQRASRMDSGGYSLNGTFDHHVDVAYSIWITNEHEGRNDIRVEWEFEPAEELDEPVIFDAGTFMSLFVLIAITGIAIVSVILLWKKKISRMD